MLTCPMCKKTVEDEVRHCPRCSTDLALLVDYVQHQHEGLVRAAELTRAGQLDAAVWAYLEVLEVDPENAEARRQVGRVAAAVRQFDRAAPGRRWLQRLRRRARFRHWWTERKPAKIVGITLVAALLLLLGYCWGYQAGLQAERQEDLDAAAAHSGEKLQLTRLPVGL